MSLNLSPEDRAEYERRCAINNAAKEAATAAGDAKGAKKARQANTYLYQEFQRRQLPAPPEPPPSPWEFENRMTLEERVDRIERLLKIGRYDPLT